jgi:hypothetical protein
MKNPRCWKNSGDFLFHFVQPFTGKKASGDGLI